MAALRVRLRGVGLYCPTNLGGCGGEALIVNGQFKRPHFRHRPGATCQITAERIWSNYTHRLIQDEIAHWLTKQGWRAEVEHRINAASRVDVFCHPTAVIEVQLSSQDTATTIERTTRYGGNVTWLYGDFGTLSARDDLLYTEGLVRVVRAQEQPGAGGFRTEIGIATFRHPASYATEWWPLTACSFTATAGLTHPGFAQLQRALEIEKQLEKLDDQEADLEKLVTSLDRAALKVIATHTRDLNGLRRRLAWIHSQATAKVAEDKRGPRHSAWRPTDRVYSYAAQQELLQYRPATRDDAGSAEIVWPAQLPRQSANPPGVSSDRQVSIAGPRPTVFSLNDLSGWENLHRRRVPLGGAWWRMLNVQPGLMSQWASNIDGRWATGLPSHLVDPGWVALLQTTLTLNGVIDELVDKTLDPDWEVIRRLHLLGLISATGSRWQRNHDLHRALTPFEFTQPPAWVTDQP